MTYKSGIGYWGLCRGPMPLEGQRRCSQVGQSQIRLNRGVFWTILKPEADCIWHYFVLYSRKPTNKKRERNLFEIDHKYLSHRPEYHCIAQFSPYTTTQTKQVHRKSGEMYAYLDLVPVPLRYTCLCGLVTARHTLLFRGQSLHVTSLPVPPFPPECRCLT